MLIGTALAVVSDVRGDDGALHDIIGHTVRNFEAVGFKYWDRFVLIKPKGLSGRRADNSWKGRKLVERPEVCLVFKTPDRITEDQVPQ